MKPSAARNIDQPQSFEDAEAVEDVATRALLRAKSRSQDLVNRQILTGIDALDNAWGGVSRGVVTVLAGKSGTGKTSLALDIAFNIASELELEISASGESFAKNGGVVAYYTFDSSSERLATQIIAKQSSIDPYQIATGNISDTEFEKLVECSIMLQKVPLYFAETGAISFEELAKRARLFKSQRGLDVVVVDYIELMPTNTERRREMKDFRILANELDAAIICISRTKDENYEDGIYESEDYRVHTTAGQNADLALYTPSFIHEAAAGSTSFDHEPNAEFLSRAYGASVQHLQPLDALSSPSLAEVTAFMGGESTLGRSIKTLSDLARLVQDGLPSSIIDALLNVGFQQNEIESIIAPKRTLARRKSNGRLTPAESDSALRMAKLLLLAKSVFGNEKAALSWLRLSEQTKLGGKFPIELLSSETGTEAIRETLLQVIYGVSA